MAKMILNIRPVADSWRDAATLSRRGVQSACIPLMEILVLAPQLPNAQEICGLVFTSRHAVSAFVDKVGAVDWRRKPVFVVGHATAAAALDAGFVNVLIGHGGGVGLIPLILQHVPVSQGRILWPAAVDKSFDMASALAAHSYHVQTLDIYAAKCRESFSSDELKPLHNGTVSGVIIMSARSARLFCQLLNDQELNSRRPNITLIAGSPSIADAAGSGWQQILVARSSHRSRLLAIATLFYHRKLEGQVASTVTNNG